jgi:hypothetical protein
MAPLHAADGAAIGARGEEWSAGRVYDADREQRGLAPVYSVGVNAMRTALRDAPYLRSKSIRPPLMLGFQEQSRRDEQHPRRPHPIAQVEGPRDVRAKLEVERHKGHERRPHCACLTSGRPL